MSMKGVNFVLSESLALDGVTITFLPIGSAPELPKRGKFQKTFDVVYIANRLVLIICTSLPLFTVDFSFGNSGSSWLRDF